MTHGKLEREKRRQMNLGGLLSKRPFAADELSSICWKDMKWIHRIHGGEHSSGVYLVQVGSGEEARLAVVKPGSAYSAGEVFCSKFFAKIGIHTPAQIIICEGGGLDELRLAMHGTYGCQFIDEDEKLSVAKYMSPKLCTVSEYCPSMSLEHLSIVDAHQKSPVQSSVPSSVPSPVQSSVDEQIVPAESTALEAFLQQLGVIMAADLLTNNGDRCPSINSDREHKGNPGNILIANLDRKFVCCAVDNMTVGIVREAGVSRYLQCVAELVGQVFDPSVHAQDITFVQTAAAFLRVNTGVQIGCSGHEMLRTGLANGLVLLGDSFRANPLVFAEIKRGVADQLGLQIKITSKGITARTPERAFDLGWQGYELINIQFIRKVAEVIAAGAERGMA
jgi:hypothetical protein